MKKAAAMAAFLLFPIFIFFLLVNADTAVFVYGYEIKHGETSLSVFFYNYSIDRRG